MGNIGKYIGIGLAAAATGRFIARRRRRIDFRDKVALVTGGSRGLGLVLARKLADQGAHLGLLARDADELERARAQLRGKPGRAVVLPCDLRDQAQVDRAVERLERRLGPVDVLINNAGVIQVGPLEHLTMADFRQAVEIHIYGALHTTLAVLPQMRQRGAGRIVNVTSIGGKVAAPHLLAYSASKHGLVGLSNGLRHELRRHGIFVTTVVPGLMRTGSPPNAQFKGQHEKEYAWFSVGDSLPLLSINAERAADKILDACRYGEPHLTITPQARLLGIVDELFPGLIAALSDLANRLLPEPAGPEGDQARDGIHSQSDLIPPWVTALTKRAAKRNNEVVNGELR